ncbi:MAG: hypothetical protein RLZZ609_2306 [Cyanobacteriota bacterium]|jgi:hypothetical protein
MSNTSPKQETSPLLAFPWTKDLLLLLFAAALVWRVIITKVDLQGFSFNDLLALLLAVFSVGLSVAFYFKANETSNQFYDNTYKFTKEMSELLGRIESGFGERLRHLDEGYSTMVERFDKIPAYFGPTVTQVQTEEDEVTRLKEKLRKLIEDFANQAHIAEQEKKELIFKLTQTNEELAEAKNILSMMKGRIDDQERRGSLPPPYAVLRYIAREMRRKLDVSIWDGVVPDDAIINAFEAIKGGISIRVIGDMRELDLLDQENELTETGKRKLRDTLSRI